MTDDLGAIVRRPGTWLPVVLSLAALALVLGYVALFGEAQRPEPHDEGAPARLFQLLMGGSVLATLFFAGRWMPRAPRETAIVVVLQLLVAAVPIVAVLLLEP